MAEHLVLVVDDVEDNRLVLQMILEDAGFAVVHARDGLDALRHALDRRPGVILMDLRMPVMDGWEATRILKGDPRTADIPVVAFTADGYRASPRLLRQAGFSAHLAKPCPVALVLEVVRRCLHELGSGEHWLDLPQPKTLP